MRTAESFWHALATLLPRGEIWPREPDSRLMLFVRGLAGLVARWASDAWRFLAVEAFPPTAADLLSDWERVLGLPERCQALLDLTDGERRAAVRQKLARRPGRQDRAYFIERAAALGYAITITEFTPAQCAMTPCGGGVVSTSSGMLVVRSGGCGTPAIRFVWRVTVTGPRLTWFGAGSGGGRTGQDPHLRLTRASDLECLLHRLKPAHTHLIFEYTGV